ncbi:hypothetical protein BVRB_027370, partial [Beta vulgaris subsp. vulgaris]
MGRDDVSNGDGRQMMIFVDPKWDHANSRYAWQWAQSYILKLNDTIVFVTVVPSRFVDNILPALGAIGSSPSAALEISVLQQKNQGDIDAAKEVENAMQTASYDTILQTLNRYKEDAQRQGFNAEVEILEQTYSTIGATLAAWANKQKIDQGVIGPPTVRVTAEGCSNIGRKRERFILFSRT